MSCANIVLQYIDRLKFGIFTDFCVVRVHQRFKRHVSISFRPLRSCEYIIVLANFLTSFDKLCRRDSLEAGELPSFGILIFVRRIPPHGPPSVRPLFT